MFAGQETLDRKIVEWMGTVSRQTVKDR